MTDTPPIACSPRRLHPKKSIDAAEQATSINPANHPPVGVLVPTRDGGILTRADIAVLTSKYWGPRGVSLSVGFLDNSDPVFQASVLRHMNAWAHDPRPGARQANIDFHATDKPAASAQVRIATVPGDGHWSYIGTDILLAAAGQPTMNLDGFSADTSEAELCRVVRHETGHTIGCPHEHMRAELIALLDEKKTIAYYGDIEGWPEAQTRGQLLTPIEERSLLGTPRPDALSIMCYQIPATLTTNGKPILGGLDIDRSDYDFIERLYPLPDATMRVGSAVSMPGARSAPVAATAVARERKPPIDHDCVVVRLPDGVTVSIPPEATQAQIRFVLKALD